MHELVHRREKIPLTEHSSELLFQVARAPGRGHMMDRHQTFLHVKTRSHLFIRADEYTDPA